MSELIDNGAQARKEMLKHLLLQMHEGTAPDEAHKQLLHLLGLVPHGLVVEVEQELMADGMKAEEVTRLCHLHGAALQGALDRSTSSVAPDGHPAHTFAKENAALLAEIEAIDLGVARLTRISENEIPGAELLSIREHLNALADVDKHYLRKEHLLFPYLEKHGITGPPKVMWAKHDETRELLRGASDALAAAPETAKQARAVVNLTVKPAAQAVRAMIEREENILLPMALETLDELEWWEIARQGADLGFCLVEPSEGWRPESVPPAEDTRDERSDRIRLPTGGFATKELEAMLNALPLDLTFVDAEDRVRYFTQGGERVFSRSRAVLGRRVQNCHPPSSVATVEGILQGFRSGKHSRAAFWIHMRGRFVHIEYVALRDGAGTYLGCLEVTQDLTAKRALEGEQRLLSWSEERPDA